MSICKIYKYYLHDIRISPSLWPLQVLSRDFSACEWETFLQRKRDFRRGTIVPCLASTRLVQFIKTVNGWVFLIEPLGHKYMEEVSSDDIKLAMVNVSSKSCSVYRSVQMLYKCIFYSAVESKIIDSCPLWSSFFQRRKATEGTRGTYRRTGWQTSRRHQGAFSVCVCNDWSVCWLATGRNLGVKMRLCVFWCRSTIPIRTKSMAFGT